MTWKYGLKRYDNGYMELAEIYGKEGYTDGTLQIGGDDSREIIGTLRLIIEDLEDPTIIDVEGEEEE